MSVLLLAESTNGVLNRDLTAKAVSALQVLGQVTVLCADVSSAAIAEQASRIAGVSKVLAAEGEAYAKGLAEPTAALLMGLSDGFTHVAAPATATAKSILPRLAALLDVMIIPDVTKVIDAVTFERPAYAGNVIQTVRSGDPKLIFTIRTASFEAAGEGSAVPIGTVQSQDSGTLSVFVGEELSTSDRPELSAAKIVISGGRALASAENFHKLIEPLADKLGAAVGASRAAVDSGYAPNDWQVGQTGKVVAPELYVACGISGAIQHLAGMKDSKVIVAVNTDPDAPIFKVADYGLVGDLFSILPEITEMLP